MKKHYEISHDKQLTLLRAEFSKLLAKLREQGNPSFGRYVAYVSFLELLGVYVRRRYLPLADLLDRPNSGA
jgi:hypothetical protein